ncbi:WhiB family transcriptional regulator, redox-sensing transcriptional regulator [Actinopolyspora mzabensis]|uniref:Transcriptional regulator WhiB n=1 Tax=Actinopolyspora mzabensis TaxID=995066 RepID=A0A1G8XXT5_ACTMZ|nr:WhiB family transcriptional regulator, redox-sensing transcriptional regulator [Actinopolyspora mzabensis]
MMDNTNTDWQHRASCRDEDPELFFPVSEVGPGAQQVQQAKKICAQCPVSSECLAYAQRTGLDFGIFGGMTPEERREAGRRARGAARGVDSRESAARR